ncbi:hypothetical protein HGRIS_001567 [Hohenbuehelia grisea]|uniref:CHAT domain-containing protein n=1 Tax=Hohenbuehelia grisea TaxID=104357 RepID=A0ABR3JRI5_9AGAR
MASEDDSSLDREINSSTEALELCPPGDPLCSKALINLAALNDQYQQQGAEDDLEKMIKLETEALELTPPSHPLRDISLSNLAGSLKHQYQRTGAQRDLERAIELETEALELRPPGHPSFAFSSAALAETLWISASQECPSNTETVFTLVRKACIDRISPIQDSLRCVHLWVAWARQIHNDTELGNAYTTFTEVLSRYLAIGPTMQSQYSALLRQASTLSLPMDAAAHAIETGHMDRAVEFLDAGRSCFGPNAPLQRAAVSSELLGGDLAARFKSTRSELQRLSTAEARQDHVLSGDINSTLSSAISYDSGLLARKRQLHEEFEGLIALIQKHPGFEDFLGRPSFDKLKEAAREGPVIIGNCSKYSSHVMIVFANRSTPSLITLDKSFWATASRIRTLYLEARQEANGAKQRFAKKLKTVTKQLWNLVVVHVVNKLKEERVPDGSRIWWCPTSFLTILPFHAARDGYNFVIDSYISSYTPTLKALIDSHQSSPTPITKLLEPHPTILVIAQTLDRNLPSAGKEIAVMRKLGSFVECLDAQEATYASVLRHLPSCSLAHFICHGLAAPIPFDSSLRLHDKPLTLNDIINVHLPNAQFAFLAACHTAEHSASAPQDEVLHLAGAMQFSGFRSVVGTMWEMVDQDGLDVAEKFYVEMLTQDNDMGQRHTRAARTLWAATKALKEKGVRMDRWVNFVHIGSVVIGQRRSRTGSHVEISRISLIMCIGKEASISRPQDHSQMKATHASHAPQTYRTVSFTSASFFADP